MKLCNFCGNKNLKDHKVQYIFKQAEDFLVVNNVPCLECEFCGEQYFHAAVLKKIEKDYWQIQQRRKKAKRTIRVPIEEFGAIK